MNERPAFVLVPGASHGAWCWQRVIGALDAMGYESIAVDLPSDDDSAGALRYAEVVLERIGSLDSDPVLVGHSLGGLTIPIVATMRPVRSLIFVAGVTPVPGMSLMQQRAIETDMVFPNRSEGLRERYYTHATEQDAEWAIAQLRPQSQTPFDEITPLEAWPDVEIASIVPTDDRTVNPEFGRRAARERFGVEPLELPGADHSPFLSRPADLAGLLLDAVGRP